MSLILLNFNITLKEKDSIEKMDAARFSISKSVEIVEKLV